MTPLHPRLIDTAGEPENDVMLATAVAAGVASELYESGREVRFRVVPTRERVVVTLCDADGVVLSRLSAGRALGIAAGELLL